MHDVDRCLPFTCAASRIRMRATSVGAFNLAFNLQPPAAARRGKRFLLLA